MVSVLFAGSLGWVAGILINYLADVLPAYRRLIAPACLTCNKPMRPDHYFLWPRRCQNCGARRSRRVWIVEATAVASAIWLWLSPPLHLNFAFGFILLVYFGLVTVIDLEHRLILHPVSLAGSILGLVAGTWLHGLKATLLGGVAGFGSMLLLYFLGVLLVRVFGRWRRGDEGDPCVEDEEALGFGDVNLSGVLGLMLGWPGILAGLGLTILLAGAASLLYLLIMLVTKRYHPNAAIPYGPFLVASAVILLYLRGDLFAIL